MITYFQKRKPAWRTCFTQCFPLSCRKMPLWPKAWKFASFPNINREIESFALCLLHLFPFCKAPLNPGLEFCLFSKKGGKFGLAHLFYSTFSLFLPRKAPLTPGLDNCLFLKKKRGIQSGAFCLLSLFPCCKAPLSPGLDICLYYKKMKIKRLKASWGQRYPCPASLMWWSRKGQQGSGPDRGQSPVEWGEIPFVHPSVPKSIHPSLHPTIRV